MLTMLPNWELGNEPEVARSQIPSNTIGNLKTVQVMRKIAHDRAGHPTVRALALAIINHERTLSHDYVNEALAIGRFVQRHVAYVRDAAGFEQLHDPILMIEKINAGQARGDCDDMALLIVTLLLSIGHFPSFRVVKYNRASPSFNHIYVVDYERNGRGPRERVVLDAIMKDEPMGYEVPHVQGKEIEA